MAVREGGSKAAAACRKRKADPTTPRSIAARSRNKDPCEGCKNSRQACSGGPPNTCSRCETKGIFCKLGRPPAGTLRINTDQIETEFIFEDGRSSTRTRHRSNTVQSMASSVISPSNEATTLLSPTSPAIPLPSGSPLYNCVSPTTQLPATFGSQSFGEGEAASSATDSIPVAGSSITRNQNSSRDDQAPLAGNMACSDTHSSASTSGVDIHASSDASGLLGSECISLSMTYQEGEINTTSNIHWNVPFDGSAGYPHAQQLISRATYDSPVSRSLSAAGDATEAGGLASGSVFDGSNIPINDSDYQPFENDLESIFFDFNTSPDPAGVTLTEQGPAYFHWLNSLWAGY